MYIIYFLTYCAAHTHNVENVEKAYHLQLLGVGIVLLVIMFQGHDRKSSFLAI